MTGENMPRTWETYTYRCTRGEGEIYYLKNNADLRKLGFYAFREPILRVRLVEDAADDYRVWLDQKQPDVASLLAESRYFDIQFVYGSAAEAARGKGEVVPVRVVELEVVQTADR